MGADHASNAIRSLREDDPAKLEPQHDAYKGKETLHRRALCGSRQGKSCAANCVAVCCQVT
eukprot:364166-Chlamydomonas_euryale.AAC.7